MVVYKNVCRIKKRCSADCIIMLSFPSDFVLEFGGIFHVRALRLPKSLDELLLDAERDEFLYRVINALPETQKRRFLLHYEYGYRMIGRMEGCSERTAQHSAALAKEKIKTQMKKCLCA